MPYAVPNVFEARTPVGRQMSEAIQMAFSGPTAAERNLVAAQVDANTAAAEKHRYEVQKDQKRLTAFEQAYADGLANAQLGALAPYLVESTDDARKFYALGQLQPGATPEQLTAAQMAMGGAYSTTPLGLDQAAGLKPVKVGEGERVLLPLPLQEATGLGQVHQGYKAEAFSDLPSLEQAAALNALPSTDEVKAQSALNYFDLSPSAPTASGQGSQFSRLDPADQLALTMLAEDGQSMEGMEAVGNVVMNRLRSGRWGNSLADVLLAPNQFEPLADPDSLLQLRQSPGFQQARELAQMALSGQLPDRTGGAMHFYAPNAQAALGRNTPSWALGLEGQQIGNQLFFSGVDGEPAPSQREQDMRTFIGVAPKPGTDEGNKTVPVGVLKIEKDHVDALTTGSQIVPDVDHFIDLIQRGEMATGMLSGTRSAGANALGIGATDRTRNRALFDTFLQAMRNDVLLLSKGVQTEGDAQRAMDELLSNPSAEPRTLLAHLTALRNGVQNDMQLQAARVQELREAAGAPPADLSRFGNVQSRFYQGPQEGTPATAAPATAAPAVPPGAVALDPAGAEYLRRYRGAQ